jgi:dihydrofolate synthase/folylpolyglutamate synthase
MPVEELKQKAEAFGCYGNTYANVNEAIRAAKENSTADDFIFVGGSTFVVAEVEDL